jgi:hypothetical protein
LEVAALKEYNDYVGITRRYLKNYNQLRIAIENLDEDINARKELLRDESVAISRYGTQPGGGFSELTQAEAAAAKRVKCEQEIIELQSNKAEIERIIRKVDRALEGLSDADCDLVKGYYIDGYSWRQLGQQQFCSEKWARDKGNKALKEVAFMVFGIVVKPRQLRFVFAG